jgi:hypothetical protein
VRRLQTHDTSGTSPLQKRIWPKESTTVIDSLIIPDSSALKELDMSPFYKVLSRVSEQIYDILNIRFIIQFLIT